MTSTHINNHRLTFILVPNGDLFTIRIHYTNGGLEKLVGYGDYFCANQMSRLELISMARKFELEVDCCNIWWLDVRSESKGLRVMKNDLDALTMVENVDSSKKVFVCVRIANSRGDHGVGFHDIGGSSDNSVGETRSDKVGNEHEEEKEVEEMHEEDNDLKGTLIGIGKIVRRKREMKIMTSMNLTKALARTQMKKA